jgi:hypothetical protein
MAAGRSLTLPVPSLAQVGRGLIYAYHLELHVWAWRLLKLGLELKRATDRVDEEMAQEMVDRMRADVPRGATGRLYNGIEWFRDGAGAIVVQAEAIRITKGGRESANYAAYVERGTRAGVRGRRISYVADSSYFDLSANISNARPRNTRTDRRTRKVYRTHPGTPARPFFFHNVQDVLAERRRRQRKAMTDVGVRAGLDIGTDIAVDYAIGAGVSAVGTYLAPPTPVGAPMTITLGPGDYSWSN